MPDNDSSANNPQAPVGDDWLKQAHDWWTKALSDAGAGFRARLDAEARKPRKTVQPQPLTEFDQHFFQMAEPKLAGFVRLGAHLVGSGLESFSCAHDRVMQAAIKLGALHLSEEARFQMDEWIDKAIVTWIDEPGPDGVISLQRLRSISGEPR